VQSGNSIDVKNTPSSFVAEMGLMVNGCWWELLAKRGAVLSRFVDERLWLALKLP
jgi:hypothetical protein